MQYLAVFNFFLFKSLSSYFDMIKLEIYTYTAQSLTATLINPNLFQPINDTNMKTLENSSFAVIETVH